MSSSGKILTILNISWKSLDTQLNCNKIIKEKLHAGVISDKYWSLLHKNSSAKYLVE